MDKESPSYAVLLENVQGHKEHILDTTHAPSFGQVEIPKGSVIESLIPSDVSAIKQVYKLQASHTVYSSCPQVQSGVLLFASPEQLYKLTVKQRDLLLAVDSCLDRIEVLNKLCWIELLAQGSKVYVTLATIPVPVNGIIRYVGNLSGLDGTRFGVELMDRRGEGDSDGSFQGQYCFMCDNNCAVFVSMDMLTDYKAADAAKPSDEPVPSGNFPPVRTDDYVTFSDKHGYRHRGLVRWIGTDKSLLSDGTTIVGIEAEMPLDLTEIPHHIMAPSEHSYFSVELQELKVFLPVQYINRESVKNANEQNNQGNGAEDSWIIVGRDSKFHDALTHQPSETDTQSDKMSDTRIQESFSLRHIDGLSTSDIFPNPHHLKVGSAIEYGEQSGEVKWIGVLPENEDKNIMAGIEMDEEIEEENNDGFWAGVECYTCTPNRRIFVQLTKLLPYKGPRPKKLPKDQNPHKLAVGSAIQYGDPPKYGVIKWLGKFPQGERMYGGIEMDEVIQDASDGFCDGMKYFKSQPGRGIFQLLLSLKPDQRTVTKSELVPKEPAAQHLQLTHHKHHWMNYAKSVGRFAHKMCQMGLYSEENNEDENLPSLQLHSNERFANKIECSVNSPTLKAYKFEVGSAVQYGNPVRYGTIKKLMMSPGCSEQCASVEWELGGCGEIQISELQPDGRFIVDVNDTTGQLNPLEAMLYIYDEKELLVVPPEKFDVRKHTETKGIQGCHNSCYLDATLYGLFAFSDAFDFVLLDMVTTGGEEQHLQKMLKNKIVYPLRVVGVVIQDSIQVFRTHLADLQKMKGYTSDEKDPEEFLNLLFKHILHLDPFVHIRRPSGIDQEFLIQLFVEPIEGVSVVYTQELLTKMFLGQDISFVKYPSRLLLQMPRYGKRFKSFQSIIPSLELDIKELCKSKSGQCFMCNNTSSYVCNDCNNEPSLQASKKLFFCDNCSFLWHNHPNRQSHRPHQLKSTGTDDDFDTGKLQLLSVLCIETSHYVCFTRVTENDWVFFDSMAERLDSGYNLPKVTVCTQLLQEYVYGKKDISEVPSKSLPELVRRFVEDAYMCIYVDLDGVMYQ